MATKQMVIMLIQKDYIKFGLKNKSFLNKKSIHDVNATLLADSTNYMYKSTAENDITSSGNYMTHTTKDDDKSENALLERNCRLKKELKRFGKRMQEDLRDGNFVSAVQSFCQI